MGNSLLGTACAVHTTRHLLEVPLRAWGSPLRPPSLRRSLRGPQVPRAASGAREALQKDPPHVVHSVWNPRLSHEPAPLPTRTYARVSRVVQITDGDGDKVQGGTCGLWSAGENQVLSALKVRAAVTSSSCATPAVVTSSKVAHGHTVVSPRRSRSDWDFLTYDSFFWDL